MDRPRALRLARGRGAALRDDLERFVSHLLEVLPAAFESEDYRARLRGLEKELETARERRMQDTQNRAQQRDLVLVRTPMGVGVLPLRGGKAVDPEEFARLPEDEQARLHAAMHDFEPELARLIEDLPGLRQEHHRRVEELNRAVARAAVARLAAPLRERWAELPDVLRHLDAVEKDAVEHVHELMEAGEQAPGGQVAEALRRFFSEGPWSRRYAVNVLVDHAATSGAPVVYEENPTLARLVGRIEHHQRMGVLVADLALVKGGALHQANGGYLVLDAHKVLSQPFAWDALKRALRTAEIRHESVNELLSISGTATLEPAPIPLDVKVVLVGERWIYHLLAAHDPELLELFKVAADFDESTARDDDGVRALARLVASITRSEGLLPVDGDGVARLVEHAARLADDAEKLSTSTRALADLLRESDRLARAASRAAIGRADIEAVQAAQVRRQDRVPTRIREAIRRGELLVEVSGARVGQVNGLAAVRLGELDFGFPTRITARVRYGRGEVVDIEREAALGGPLHSKGVLILAGYLGGRYARDRPLALGVSLVFEQSYGAVEGDSASAAELVALLSALAEAPLTQALAITGSVDQRGQIQPIGAVNQKIEGFFDACRELGLTGEQGVVIPAANRSHLMLRDDVVAAVAEGRFRVHAVETVDQLLGLMTGVDVGELDQRIEARLAALAEKARQFARGLEG
jgi:predicted ATP-dependent protease